MSEDGLVAELDRIAERSELGAQCYLEELTRRELARQTTILVRLSWIMALQIFVVTLLAVALVLNS
jgi:thiamine monophosphate kinase